MKKLFLLGALCLATLVPAFAQPSGTSAPAAPDCYDQGTFQVASGTVTIQVPAGTTLTQSNSVPRDWTRSACTAWHLFYQTTSGISAISIEMDAASEGSSFGTPGSFAAISGLAAGSTNPTTITGSGSISASPLSTPGFVEVTVNSVTGSGTVTWELFGYRPGVQTTPQNGFGSLGSNQPAATLGWLPQLVTSLTNTSQTIKSTYGELGFYHCYNPNASVAYVQVYDTAGAVTVGTTTPKFVIPVPATNGTPIEISLGIHFANAIKVAATTGATNGTAPGTALVCSFLYY